jgi:P4 family phage/plasmid primase-like protien
MNELDVSISHEVDIQNISWVEPATEIDYSPILEKVINSPGNQQLSALHAFAEMFAIDEADDLTIDHFARKLQRANICDKKTFLSYVMKTKKVNDNSEVNQLEKTSLPTDDELADRWLNEFPETAFGLGEFRRCSDGVWPKIPKDTVMAEIDQVLINAKEEGIRPSSYLRASVLELGRVRVSIPSEQWDNQPDLLPCKNGVVQLSTRTLHPHNPNLHFISGVDYDYDPFAQCPNFLKALQTTIPDTINFIQDFAGYSLTIDTRHEMAIWLYGPPGCGKSTVLVGLQTLLGPLAGVLGLGEIERNRFCLSNLPGKRLLTSSEQPVGRVTASHTLNALISGEQIELDRKYKEIEQITPHAKIIWAMNERPSTYSSDDGLFRRVKIIQFPNLDEKDRDPSLKEAIQGEGPGILNWALAGLTRLKKRGKFDIPACVKEATQQYKAENDSASLFVSECCCIGREGKVKSSALYEAYAEWCQKNDYRKKTQTSIAEDWKRLKFENYEANGHKWWRGVSLLK